MGQCGSDSLGKAIIFSALVTEWALIDLISAEAEKVRKAICMDTDAYGLAAVDNSIANVLGQVAAIECKVIEKLNIGKCLLNEEA